MIEPEILEAIEKSEPRPEIVAALNDDLLTAGIVTAEDPNAFVGSRLYNISSAALNIRRAEPDAQLAERPTNVLARGHALGRFTCRILDNSIPGKGIKDKREYTREGSILPKIPTDSSRELQFVRAANQADADKRLYINQRGQAYLFELDDEDYSISLSLKPVIMDKIKYPAGTFFVTEPKQDERSETYGSYELQKIGKQNPAQIAPLRVSLFAFQDDDRQKIITPPTGIESRISAIEQQILGSIVLADITASLPAQHDLKSHLKTLAHK